MEPLNMYFINIIFVLLMMKRNDQWHTQRSCEYYAKAVVYLRLNPKYFF